MYAILTGLIGSYALYSFITNRIKNICYKQHTIFYSMYRGIYLLAKKEDVKKYTHYVIHYYELALPNKTGKLHISL